MKITFQIHKALKTRGQAIVEFTLVLMILMVVMVGLFEVGRLLFIYVSVNNASREAARYASAIGLDTDPDTGITSEKYRYCTMIGKMARRSAFFTPLTISVSYDHGPGTGSFDTCDGSVDPGVSVNSGSNQDRVQVTVSANYVPMVSLVPLSSRTITSSNARTILGYVDLESPASGSVSTPASTVTSTPGGPLPSDTPTATVASETPTATQPGEVITFTPLPSSTATLIPTFTSTATMMPTATETSTPTLTFTPTITPTAKLGCDSITTSPIRIYSNAMGFSITNPHDTVTVQSIQVTWNATNGGEGGIPLALKNIRLGDVIWTGTDTTGNLTFTPPTTVTIPGNNSTSAIVFTFDNNYENTNNAESIIISLSTPGCEKYAIRRP